MEELKLKELDMLKSLLADFQEAIEFRMIGDQNSMYFTREEMSFMEKLISNRIREVS